MCSGVPASTTETVGFDEHERNETLRFPDAVLGIGDYVAFMLGLRRERARMKAAGLIHPESSYPISLTLIVAVVLLAIGIMAIASMWLHVGTFG
ncbi:MAG TPA: hypothetical protein VJV77_09830 [Casimicrobiaceae bacterium]|nr:hypothetical protein [Casimicrobiaceae bacterium]